MSLSPSVFPVYMPKVMIKFMDQYIRIKQVIFARYVDSPFSMHITAKRLLLPSRQTNP